NSNPKIGDTINFTVTLTNLGVDVANNVVVSDKLPTGLTFQSASASQGNYDSGTGFWNVGDVALGVPQTLVLTAVVAVPTPLTNTATITHSDQFAPNPTNNPASATETPQHADLALSKSADQRQAFVGTNITYTFIIRNLGPGPATGVVV